MATTKMNDPPRIMVFRPTMEEFSNFSEYIEYMESQGANRAGLAKIIPPKGWKPRKNGYADVEEFVIPAPISQEVQGRQGLYQQYNIQKKSITVREYKKLAESEKYQTPSHFDYEELERKYWKNLTYISPLYGADISGSIYDKDVNEFNINRLNTCLDLIGEDYKIKIEGVNTAYLYFGMWKTTFAWHTEDMDLYSINYVHFGAPKSWYAVPPEHGKRLERLAAGFFPSSVQICPAFLRHKMTIISPQILKQYSIPFNKITQEPGEFMITFPYGYHSGYNHGYNCAESTNFALPRWIEYGKRCSRCTCRNDSVKISMESFVKKFQPERYQLWLEGKDMGCHPEDPTRVFAAHPPGRIKNMKFDRKMGRPEVRPKRHPAHIKMEKNGSNAENVMKKCMNKIDAKIDKETEPDSEDEHESSTDEMYSIDEKSAVKRKHVDLQGMFKKVKSDTEESQEQSLTPTSNYTIINDPTSKQHLALSLTSLPKTLKSPTCKPIKASKPRKPKKQLTAMDSDIKVEPVALPAFLDSAKLPILGQLKQQHTILSSTELSISLLEDNATAVQHGGIESVMPVKLEASNELSTSDNVQAAQFSPTNSSSVIYPSVTTDMSTETVQLHLPPWMFGRQQNAGEVAILPISSPVSYILPDSITPQTVDNAQNSGTFEQDGTISKHISSAPSISSEPIANVQTVAAASSLLALSQQPSLSVNKDVESVLPDVSSDHMYCFMPNQSSNHFNSVSKNTPSLLSSSASKSSKSKLCARKTKCEPQPSIISPSRTLDCDIDSKESFEGQSILPTKESSPFDSRNIFNSVQDDVIDMKQVWQHVVRNLWHHKPKNFDAEKEFNEWCSLVKPHCAVCMIFKPFADVISRKDVQPTVPETSSVEMPIAYYDIVSSSGDSVNTEKSNKLLVCSECNVCVHTCCYGVTNVTADWKCDRCSMDDGTAECALCNIRGGPLKPTKNDKWIHITCALILPDVKFKDSVSYIDCSSLSSARQILKCSFCNNKSGGKSSKMACTQCSVGRCLQSFHVTCGYLAGVIYEKCDWPSPIKVLCLKHNGKNGRVKAPERKLLPVHEGSAVIAKHRNSRFYWSEILEMTTQTFYSVTFEDGTYSEDLFPEDIVSHDCVKYGPPKGGARVSVLWTDGNIYSAVFKESSTCVMCTVEFEDGSVNKVKRTNVYADGEELPKKVTSRLSLATEGKHTDIFDHNKQAEGKRIRHLNMKYSSECILPTNTFPFVNN